MPRKTARTRSKRRWKRPGFNEAAARCHGKLPHGRRLPRRTPASMRPRPDATENLLRTACREKEAAASMRPRPDATENALEGGAARVDGPPLQ